MRKGKIIHSCVYVEQKSLTWHADSGEKIHTTQRVFLFVYSSQRWTHSSLCSLHLA